MIRYGIFLCFWLSIFAVAVALAQPYPHTDPTNQGGWVAYDLMTGQFMVSNWESIWEYHNKVAANGNLTGTPGSGDVGGNSWTVQVSDGSLTDTATLNITVNDGGGPVSFTIEAEDFDVNGGVQTYTIGGVTAINWVEANDYVEYNVNVPESGTYTIDYYISTPLDGSTIAFQLNGTTVVTDNVPNNGSWDVFTTAVRSSSTVSMNAGNNTIRLVAGTNAWQWNLDKVVLSK